MYILREGLCVKFMLNRKFSLILMNDQAFLAA